ncbi:interleukin-10 receptor subunit alpha [Aplochiton taeniatus]
MDFNFTISIIASLLKFASSASGADIPKPTNLMVNIWDGEVEVLWDHPLGAPLEPSYHTQIMKYGSSDWVDVKSCIRTHVTYCYLTHLIKDYSSRYIVRVQLVTEKGGSAWTTRKIYPNQSKLQPPSFNLVATSSSVRVHVHRKPILKKIFLLGMTYAINLEEMGPDNKTTLKYLSDGEDEDEGTVRFDSLLWGRQYCVSIKEMATGTAFSSEISPRQCLHLPEQEWYIMAVWSLSVMSVMGVFTFLVTGILCYLRYPAKMPIALKDTKTVWSPLLIGEIPLEVVTNNGWLLIKAETPTKTLVAQKMETTQAVEREKEDGEEERRMNNDSGVGMKFTDGGIGIDTKFQGNSGCHSLANSESLVSNGNRTGEFLMQNRTKSSFRQSEDSGMGLVFLSDSSGSLEVEEHVTEQGFLSDRSSQRIADGHTVQSSES